MALEGGKNKHLKISVVMCTYNGARYLREQLDTILAQTYPVYEIVVQDDNSTDETLSILESYAERYPVIHVFRNESGLHGINGNFFSAMARATGDYIAISDQDDIWEKNKLRCQAEGIGDKLLCSAFSLPFSDDGFPIKADMRVPNTHLVRNTYICELPGHSMLFHRSLLAYIVGGETLPLYYDWQLLNVAAAAESIVFLKKVLVHFRRHSDAATASVPVDNRLFSSSAINYVRLSLFHHRTLQKAVRRRFSTVLPFLEKLPFQTKSLKDAIYMSKLQLRKDLPAFFLRVVFFMKHSRQLFHAEESRSIIRIMRAMFFVYSCGYYYRSCLGDRYGKKSHKPQ